MHFNIVKEFIQNSSSDYISEFPTPEMVSEIMNNMEDATESELRKIVAYWYKEYNLTSTLLDTKEIIKHIPSNEYYWYLCQDKNQIFLLFLELEGRVSNRLLGGKQ